MSTFNFLAIMEELNSIEAGENDNGVWGLGLGAAPQAKRWAAMGKFLDRPEIRALLVAGTLQFEKHQMEQISAVLKKRGRPELNPIQSKDAKRAFRLWELANRLEKLGKGKKTNRDLIKFRQQIDAMHPDDDWNGLFPKAEGGLDQSVSRGRKILEIEGYWVSKVCEEIASI